MVYRHCAAGLLEWLPLCASFVLCTDQLSNLSNYNNRLVTQYNYYDCVAGGNYSHAAHVTTRWCFLVKGNSVVTDVQFGHLFLVCIKYDALQEVTCGLFRKISHCS